MSYVKEYVLVFTRNAERGSGALVFPISFLRAAAYPLGVLALLHFVALCCIGARAPIMVDAC